MHSIRKFVGRGTFALALAALLALAVSVQAGQAARSSVHSSVVQPRAHALSAALPLHEAEVAPSPACAAAVNTLKGATASDKTEDGLESANAAVDTETGAELTEDTNEKAALQPLVTAAVSACGGSLHEVEKPPVPKTPACATALQALKAAFVRDRAEDQAELTSGTERTTADQAEDQSEMAAKMPLWNAVPASCAGGFKTFSRTSGGFDDTWNHR